jgi:hypothetical protein
MADQQARHAIRQLTGTMGQLGKVVAVATEEHEERLARELQEQAQNAIIETTAKLFDRAAAYTNLITLGGYAAGFAIWSATRTQLPARANVVFAMVFGFSLAVFVFFEVYKTVVTSLAFMRNRRLVDSSLPPRQFLDRLKAAELKEARTALSLMRVWQLALICAALPALAAIGLLFYNYVAITVGWAAWPT